MRPFHLAHPVEVAELRVDAVARLAREQLQREAGGGGRLVPFLERRVPGHGVHVPSRHRLLGGELDLSRRRGEAQVCERHVAAARRIDRPVFQLVEQVRPFGPEHVPQHAAGVVHVPGEIPGVEAETLGQQAPDLGLGLHTRGRIEHLGAALQVRVPVRRAEVLLLEHRLGRQHVVRQAGGVGEELVDHDHQVEAGERVAHESRARVLARRIPLLNPGGPHARRVEREQPGPQARHGDGRPPVGPRRQRRIREAVAREIRVLEAAARDADVSGQRRQQRHRPHRLPRVVVALQPEAGDEQGGLRASVVEGERLDRRGRYAGDVSHAIERVPLDALEVSLDARRVRSQERLVVEAGADDGARHPEREGGVGARPGLHVEIGGVARVGGARIDHRDARPAFLRLEDEPHLVHVRLGRVVAPDQEVARVGGEARVVMAVGAVGQPRGLQPGRPAEVAVGPRATSELAPERAGEPPERAMAARGLVVEHRLGAVVAAERVEPGRDVGECRVPRHGLERPGCRAPQRRHQPVGGREAAGVADALQAHVPVRGRVGRIALDADDAAILDGDEHAAGAVAVARADGAEHGHGGDSVP